MVVKRCDEAECCCGDGCALPGGVRLGPSSGAHLLARRGRLLRATPCIRGQGQSRWQGWARRSRLPRHGGFGSPVRPGVPLPNSQRGCSGCWPAWNSHLLRLGRPPCELGVTSRGGLHQGLLRSRLPVTAAWRRQRPQARLRAAISEGDDPQRWKRSGNGRWQPPAVSAPVSPCESGTASSVVPAP